MPEIQSRCTGTREKERLKRWIVIRFLKTVSALFNGAFCIYFVCGYCQWRIPKFCKACQCVSPVVIYRKWTQRTICLVTGKWGLWEKILANREVGGRPQRRPPFESATGYYIYICISQSQLLTFLLHKF